MTITWAQLISTLGAIAVGITGIVGWLAKRDAKRSDTCEARVTALETDIKALQTDFRNLQDKNVDRMELLLKRSFESNEAVAKGLTALADQIEEQRNSSPRLLREAFSAAMKDAKETR